MDFLKLIERVVPVYKQNSSLMEKNISLSALALIVGFFVFLFSEHLNSKNIEVLNQQIKLRDDKLSGKFENTTPDEAKVLIRTLKERLDNIEQNSKINPSVALPQSYQNSLIQLPYSGNWQNIDEPSQRWCYSGIRDPDTFNLFISSSEKHKIFIGYDINSTCKNLASHLSNLFEKNGWNATYDVFNKKDKKFWTGITLMVENKYSLTKLEESIKSAFFLGGVKVYLKDGKRADFDIELVVLD